MDISRNRWILLFFVFLFSANAQDTIYNLGNEKINAKIIEIDTDTDVLKYKLTSNPNGPLYVISIKKISKIVYSNGVSDSFQVVNSSKTSSDEKATIHLASGEKREVYIVSKNETDKVLTYTLAHDISSPVFVLDLGTVEKIVYENGKSELRVVDMIKSNEKTIEPVIDDSIMNYIALDVVAPLAYKLFSISYERIFNKGTKGIKFIFSTNPGSSPAAYGSQFPKRSDTRYALGVDYNFYINNLFRSSQSFFIGPAVEIGSFVYNDQTYTLASKDTVYNYQYPNLKDTIYHYSFDTKHKTTYKVIFAAKCGVIFKMSKHFFCSSQITLGVNHVGHKYNEATNYYNYYNSENIQYHSIPNAYFVRPVPLGYQNRHSTLLKMNFELNFGFRF